MADTDSIWTDRKLRSLRGLLRTHRSLEKARIQLGNRLAALELEVDQVEDEVAALYHRTFEAVKAEEDECERMLRAYVAQHPCWPWLSSIRGVSYSISAALLGTLYPPLEGTGPSTWFKAAGLNVVETKNGEMHLPRLDQLKQEDDEWQSAAFKDVLLPGGKTKRAPTWYPYLRRSCFILGDCQIKQGRFYRAFYDQVRARLVEIHPDWKPWKLHAVARIRMVKLILSHLYRVWAEAEGITIREPYPIEILGHTGIIPVPQGDQI